MAFGCWLSAVSSWQALEIRVLAYRKTEGLRKKSGILHQVVVYYWYEK